MMAQEVDLLSFIPFHSLMGGEMICSRSASSAGSSDLVIVMMTMMMMSLMVMMMMMMCQGSGAGRSPRKWNGATITGQTISKQSLSCTAGNESTTL